MKESVFNNKLNSKNGASILVALFVLLVCTIISSIVVTAGFASAGRIVGVAQSDQRYYTVTSAANILKDTIENNSVTIVREYKDDSYTFSFLKDNGELVTLRMGLGLLNDIAIEYGELVVDVNTNEVINNETNYDKNYKTLDSTLVYTPTNILVETSNSDMDDIRVSIGLDNKQLIMIVYDNNSGDSGSYNLKYTYSSDIRDYEDENENEGSTTKYTEIAWVLEKVEKV